MKKLISVLAISALMFGVTSIGVFAYQGDGICPNNGECTHENCPNYGEFQNYGLTKKGDNQKKADNGTGQAKRARIYQGTRMNCNR
ncbi:MAG: hypothetical protein ACK5L6_01705 [Anaerorhabdus sp.]|uniref:hypothetical protein n=1 Tax=Anaerorhabdus sp. TaxID=1872524 RepID=UPI003A84EBC4